MDSEIKLLKLHMAEVVDLQRSAALLSWDQQTYMPSGGSKDRAQQLATLEGLAHRLFISNKVGDLIGELESNVNDIDYDSDDASFIRYVSKKFKREKRMPNSLVSDLANTTSLAQEAWVLARQNNDYALFQPHLQKVLDLTRQKSECFTPWDNVYDPLLDIYEPDMKTSELQNIFSDIKDELIDLVSAIQGSNVKVDNSILYGDFEENMQREFGLTIARSFGYDFRRGRLDETVHPFCTHFSLDDVRITTRFDRKCLSSALFGIMHEVGHALYEQGISPQLSRTGLDTGVSLGVHESQSRLWENLIGRSRSFWKYYFPVLQKMFLGIFDNVSAEEFYFSINQSKPSLIRVEADEVTYNLHIIIRFELELDMLNGDLQLNDLPEAWADKYKTYLGLSPTNYVNGVLQDIHWSIGAIGYFPTYTIGNLMSVQLLQAAKKEIGDLDNQISQSDFADLLAWLRHNIHCHGSKYSPRELLHRITDNSVDPKPYMEYLHNKYSEIYRI